MGRLFAPEVLPETVDKALYLDCDTIVCSSIEKMYETPLGDCLAGMIMEPTVYKEMKESIDMDKDDAYFKLRCDLNGRGWLAQGKCAEETAGFLRGSCRKPFCL